MGRSRTWTTRSTRWSTTGSSRRGRVRHPRLRRGLPGDRIRGPWGVEVLSEALRNLPIEDEFDARIRDDDRAVRRWRHQALSERVGESSTDNWRARRRPADLDVHPDAADPRVRGAGQADVRGAPRGDPRPHAPGRRRRGVDRRLAGDAPARRPDDGHVPLSRLPDRARYRHEGDHGRDLRPQGRAVRRLRRLDAPGRSRARLPGHVGDRRPGDPAGHRRRLGRTDPQAGPGRPVLLRRRRLQAGRVPRVAQPRIAVEAADRLHDGEQQLQRRHAIRAGGRQRRRRRAAVGQGHGVQHARRHHRRRRPARGVRGRGERRSTAPARARARPWWSPRSTACRLTAT